MYEGTPSPTMLNWRRGGALSWEVKVDTALYNNAQAAADFSNVAILKDEEDGVVSSIEEESSSDMTLLLLLLLRLRQV
jgi:hypothetical protein